MQSHKKSLIQLFPLTIDDAAFQADVTAEGNALDQVSSEVDVLYKNGNIAALDDDEIIKDWLDTMELSTTGNPIEDRQNIMARLLETGSLRLSYFQAIAEALGYTVTMKEVEPLMPGVMRVGDFCRSAEGGFYAVRVLVYGEAGPIARLEDAINRIKPAEAQFEFAYELGEV